MSSMVQGSGMQLGLFDDPPAEAPAASQLPGTTVATPISHPLVHEHSQGEVMRAQLPDGWELVSDGWNGLVLRPPEEWVNNPWGSYPRFPYDAKKGSLEAAIAKAEAGVRRLVSGQPWSGAIQVESHYFVERERIESVCEAWRRNGWNKLPRISGSRYVLDHLCKPGVIEQLPNELRPPAGVLERAQQASMTKRQAELEHEAEAEDEDDGEDLDDE